MSNRSFFLPDLFITLPIILLLSLGILVIYSSSPQLALQQTIFAVIGLILFWFLSNIDIEPLAQYAPFFYFLILGLLVVVFLLGVETRGSVRWIPLGGTQIQPSEFAKPVFIFFLAKFWTEHLPTWVNVGKSFLWSLPMIALIFRQPDLGTTLTLVVVWLSILIGANISYVKLLLMGVVGAVSMPFGWVFLQDYQKDRIFSFLSPTRDPLGVGYNVIQSMIAVGSGQLFGRGLGRGTQSRLQFLPEFRTDFIFASIAEELGLFGSLMVLSLYGVLVARSLRIVSSINSRFGGLIVLGVVGMLFFQIIVNIGMNIGIVPITGITLPLLSLGGSSLVTTLISLGLVVSVAHFSKKRTGFGEG